MEKLMALVLLKSGETVTEAQWIELTGQPPYRVRAELKRNGITTVTRETALEYIFKRNEEAVLALANMHREKHEKHETLWKNMEKRARQKPEPLADDNPYAATGHPITQQNMGLRMNIKLPLKHNELPISAAHANEWKATLIERMATLGASVYEKLEISAEEKHLVFWCATGLLWALMYLPPAALTASERASLVIGLTPNDPERLLSAMDSLADKLQSLSVDAAATASKIRPNKSEIKGRVTDYISPEAAAMYRAINISCASSKHPHRRHMCEEWRDDYKAFERYFLEHNVKEIFVGRYKVDKEGIIAGVLNDPDSPLHGQVVYGPGTVMFVNKFVQNFYNRTKRDFSAKLEELRVMGTINESEYLFMKKKGV